MTDMRAANRGADLRDVIAAVTAAMARPGNDGGLAGVFERHVQQVLSMRAVRLREIPARYQARLVTPTRTSESIVLGVPTSDTRVQAVLEASFDRSRLLNEHDVDLLTAAAQLGGLVLEVARTRNTSHVRNAGVARPLVGGSTIMQALKQRIERVAQTDFTILIEGESGTGKELVARQVHELSRRHAGPFVAVNCAAVVDTLLEAELFGIEEHTATGVRGRRGKFEQADGGTLFLDEVSDLTPAAQAKLLRAIQDLAVEHVGGGGMRRVNTRIVAATNRPLSELAGRGMFRTDLYYRLSGVEVHVPPLRHRRDDVAGLAQHFLSQHVPELTLSEGALDVLRLHDWPGNVRELERLIERAVALAESKQIDVDDLPPHVRGQYREILAPSLSVGDSMRAWGSRYARLVFERCGRNKRLASGLLDISYHTLDAYLRWSDQPRPAGKRVPGWARAEDNGAVTGAVAE